MTHYCSHGNVIPKARDWLALASAMNVRLGWANAIAVCIDWCDICTIAPNDTQGE